MNLFVSGWGLVLVFICAGCSSEIDDNTTMTDERPAANPETEESAAAFSKVVIHAYYDSRGADDRREITISNPKEIARLASFFPGLGEGRESPEAAASEAYGKLRFVKNTGAEQRVSASFEFDTWSEGEGDWLLSEKFGPFFLGLLERAEAKQKDSASRE